MSLPLPSLAVRLCVLALCVTPLACNTVERLDFTQYKGDARLWEDPNDPPPKYWVIFPEVDLNQSGEYAFTVAGLPYAAYDLGLATRVRGDDEQRSLIGSAAIRCDFEIVEKPSTIVVTWEGFLEECPPVDFSNHNRYGAYDISDTRWFEGVRRWIYEPDPSAGGPIRFHPRPSSEYMVHVRITRECASDDPASPRLPPLAFVLFGGGERGWVPGDAHPSASELRPWSRGTSHP